MEAIEKVTTFQQELSLIQNPQLRLFAEACIRLVPDYFFTVPASSTGKYHPNYALGEGGLVRHTKAAVRLAAVLGKLEQYHFTQDEIDMAVVALLVHDGWKSGKVQSTYTLHEHPIVAATELPNALVEQAIIPGEQCAVIMNCIASHMGQWTTNSKSLVVLPQPETELEKFVHLCDYIASRKMLEFNFGVDIR